MPTYNPIDCYNILRSTTNPDTGKPYYPCPTSEGTLSPHCQEFVTTPAVHLKCAEQQSTVYTPVGYTEVYNSKLCGPDEYDPFKCQERAFATLNDALSFLRTHPDFDNRPCWCCCACFAYGTPIATPDGEKVIEFFQIGDRVLAGSVTSKDGNLMLSWDAKDVQFSSGTGPLPPAGHYPTMVFVHYGAGEGKGLIATLDQLFLMPDGKLKQAAKLSILDSLVAEDGSVVKINAVKLGEYSGGLHHIATSTRFDGSIDGHLLNSNGIVAGDYTLQIHAEQLGNLLEDGPNIGTPEYEASHKQYAVSVHAYHHPDAIGEISIPKTVKLFTGQSAHIPENAGSFFTVPQEIDIIGSRHVIIHGFANKAGTDAVNYMFKIYKASFPDINFYLDWENVNPNAYAFEEYGQQHVVVSGGLVRIEGIANALAVIIAQCVARFTKPDKEEKAKHELLPRVQADYYGIGFVMRLAWDWNWNDTVEKGIAQVNTLFSYISDNNQVGDADNPLEDPSIQCRETAMQYALLGGDLPPCAGGTPPQPELKVIGDEVGKTPDGQTFVILNFNEPLDVTSAENLDNYKATPAVNLTSATVTKEDTSKVTVVGDFAPKTDYEIVVSNVTSANGTALDSDLNSAQFKTI